MITGKVTAEREATIHLEVTGPDGSVQVIEVVVDTGFTGFLTLPGSLVRALNLPLVGHSRATLGDGSTVVLDLYLASVPWHEEAREVLVLCAEGGPLVGMSLLYGYRVILDVIDGGVISIEMLP